MKILKIEKHQGYFRTQDGEYETVDKLNKAVLLRLVNLALEDDFELDQFDEEKLKNQAHQIIYKSIGEKLTDLHNRRKTFRDESDGLYLNAYDKYKG